MPPFIGTDGDDSYWGGPDAEHIEGLGGSDYLVGNGGDDEIFGGDGDDNLHGEDGNDLLDGGAGDDFLSGGDGVDVLLGGGGNDRLLVTYLMSAGDVLDGGDGVDTLQFDAGGLAPITLNIVNSTIPQSIYGGTVVNIEMLVFRAGAGNDDITGGALTDYIDGSDGNDRIDGGLGDDTLDGGVGTDRVYGGGGNDIIRGGGDMAMSDELYGGDGNDTFYWSQDGLIDGGAGVDQVRIEYYSDTGVTVNLSNPAVETMVLGTRIIGIERLWIYTGSGNDQITGGVGDDLLAGGDGNDILNGGAGNDTLSGGNGNDQLNGGAGDDFLHNYTDDANPADVIDGGDGFDLLEFRATNATGPITIDLLATTGMVTNVEQIYFSGGSGLNNVSGGAANDTFWGGSGGDQFDGRGGDDQFFGNGGDDVIFGGGGNDYVDAGAGLDSISGGDGDDILHGMGGDDRLDGGAGADELYGEEGNDFLYGGAGNDRLFGGPGNDTLNGADGSDTADYSTAGASIIVVLQTSQAYAMRPGDAAFIGADTLLSIENVVGTGYNDEIYGDLFDNRLEGGAGNDYLFGGSGFDVLIGGYGNDELAGSDFQDTLTGGAGNDTFRDTKAGLNGDTITDFSIGDRIVLTDATLAGFTFSLDGTTLTYTGGSLTLSGPITGSLVAMAAAGGGVQLYIRDAANDFNGDGRSDVLWRNDNGTLTNWLGQADGSLAGNGAIFAAGVSSDWTVAATGDFNGDFRDDILWRNANGTLTDWLGQADGSFAPNNANFVAGIGAEWAIAGIGDFNGDHKDDILWRNADGTVTNWIGTSNGGFFPNNWNFVAGVSLDWSVAAVGDFNGDGKDDILWRNANGTITDWLGTGNAEFTPNNGNFVAGVGSEWSIAGTGDFNGDGREDILWRNANGTLTNWLGSASGGFTPNNGNFVAGIGDDWTVAQIGDFNRDGMDDILWRNTNGTVTNWLGQASGSFTPNNAVFVAGVGNDWHIQPPDLI